MIAWCRITAWVIASSQRGYSHDRTIQALHLPARGLASIFIIIAGIQNLAFILNPILLSLVITIVLIPVPGWFSRRGVPGWLSLVLIFVVISLFIWGWLLGVVGAVLSTPLTLLILTVLELFDGTRWIAMLLRTTGTGEERAVREHEEALGRARGLWERGVAAVRNTTRL